MLLKKTCSLVALTVVNACAGSPPPVTQTATTTTQPAAAPDDASALFAQLKAATGGDKWDAVTSIETKGTLRTGGMSGPLTSVTDATTGRSVTTFNLGSVSGAQGFDGNVAWERDMGGDVTTPDTPESKAQARTGAWMSAMGFWYPARGQAAFGAVRDVIDGGHTYRVVDATPLGGKPIALWFDPASHLLVRTVERQQANTVTTQLDDYEDAGGLRFPMHSTEDTTDGAGRTDPRERTEVLTEHTALNVKFADADFAVPTMAATAHVTDPSGVTHVPFDLVNNHIYADAFINGTKVRVIVDTGGVNLLTPEGAKKLGLTTEGKLAGQGVGEQKVEVGLAHAHDVKLGGAVLDNPVFYVMDLGVISSLDGAQADGLVGFEMFRRFRVTVDYAAKVLTLSEPSKFHAPEGAHVVPFELADRIPIVKGTLDGLPVRLSIDTGSRASLTMHSPFVNANGLVAKYGAASERITGWGVGGPALGRPARLGVLTLGDVTVNDIAGDLFLGNKGSFSNPDLSGNLGGGVLHRFTVSFDYDAMRMYLVPNADFAKPDPFDRSGMWLVLDGNALKIVGVAPDGPAAKAGLAANDRVARINGELVTKRTLGDWRRFLATEAAGKRVSLSIAAGGAGNARKVEVVLTDAIPAHASIHSSPP
jgi:hypothetical protein